MKVNHSIFLALIFILFQINEVISINDPCELVSDGTFIGDRDLCNGWIRCSNGTSHKGVCPEKMRFNIARAGCDLAENVKCKDDDCKNKNGEFLPDLRAPIKCSAYFYCHEGVAESYNCPDGLHYDQHKSVCSYKLTPPCKDDTIVNVCQYIPDGKNLRNPNDCSKYYECKEKKSTDKICEDGKLFDQKIGECNDADKTDCDVQCGTDNGPILNPKSCLSYYECKGGERTLKTCKSTEFVKKTETPDGDGKITIEIKCVDKLLVDEKQCPNRCEGVEKGFMPIYEPDENKRCEYYYTCSNGQAANKDNPQKCPDGFLLDYVKQLCSKKEKMNSITCTKNI